MGENVVDQTEEYFSEQSEQLTGLVKDIYKYIFKQKLNKVEKNLQNFVLHIGPQGILRMMGFRLTVGSMDQPWPNPKTLLEKFNQPIKILSLEE